MSRWYFEDNWFGRGFLKIYDWIFNRAVLRLLLVHAYKERVVRNPPIQPLNREKLSESDDEKLKEGFTLKRSGTVVRSVRGTGSVQMRTWEPLASNANDNVSLNNSPASVKKLKLAEVMEQLCEASLNILLFLRGYICSRRLIIHHFWDFFSSEV